MEVSFLTCSDCLMGLRSLFARWKDGNLRWHEIIFLIKFINLLNYCINSFAGCNWFIPRVQLPAKSGNLCDVLMHFRAKASKKRNIKLRCCLFTINHKSSIKMRVERTITAIRIYTRVAFDCRNYTKLVIRRFSTHATGDNRDEPCHP